MIPDTGFAAEPETMTAAIDRFTKRGYVESFHTDDGRIRSLGCAEAHDPEEFVVDDFARFEGASDPADEAVVFALRCIEHGIKGTYVVTYGPLTGPEDAEAMQRLKVPKR